MAASNGSIVPVPDDGMITSMEKLKWSKKCTLCISCEWQMEDLIRKTD